MNRIIKFRGKENFKSKYFPAKWYEGGLMIDGDDAWLCVKKENEGIVSIKVVPDTLGQFTGMLDSNGKEIYEDDIVNVRQGERTFGIVVKWSNEAMAFMAYYTDGNQSPLSWFSDLRMYQLRVIGSIHDAPELLNEK